MNYDIDWRDLRKILKELWLSGKLSKNDKDIVDDLSRMTKFSFYSIDWIIGKEKEILGTPSPEGGKE